MLIWNNFLFNKLTNFIWAGHKVSFLPSKVLLRLKITYRWTNAWKRMLSFKKYFLTCETFFFHLDIHSQIITLSSCIAESTRISKFRITCFVKMTLIKNKTLHTSLKFYRSSRITSGWFSGVNRCYEIMNSYLLLYFYYWLLRLKSLLFLEEISKSLKAFVHANKLR